MSVTNGQKANQTTFNNAFMSKTANSTTTAVIDLNNTSDANSGARVTNIQRALNELFDAVGMTGIGDAGRKTYSSSNYIADGDTRKVAIGKLDASLKTVADDLAAFLALQSPTTFTIVDNQGSAADVTGLLFNMVDIRSFKVEYHIWRSASGGSTRAQRGSLIGVTDGTTWLISDGPSTSVDAGVTFSITSSGQVQYVSDANGGSYLAADSKLVYTVSTFGV